MKNKVYLTLVALFSLSACGGNSVSSVSSNEEKDSSITSILNIENVIDYALDAERLYTGEMVNGLPHGQGVLTWVETNCVYTGEFKNGLYDGEGLFEWRNNGDSLEGTFKENNPVYGVFTYKNTMSYTGEFNSNWQFHGQGTFDWNTYRANGTVSSYGWLYEGEFKNGTMVNCFGKVTFTVARDGSNGEGVYWYEGKMSGFPAVAVGQYGTGFIKFNDGSTYEGDLFVKNANEFLRVGTGTQDFSNCTTLKSYDFGATHEVKLSKYVGQFNGINYGWIYGNGIVYFVDNNNQPKGYIKGFWNGTTRIGEWNGTFSDEDLLEEYRSTNEIEYKDVFERKLESFVDMNKDVDLSNKTLLLGTSWFEFWTTSYKDLLPVVESLNFGIGGSGPIFWSENIDVLEGLKNAPKNIFYMPGGNDMASRGETVEDSVNKTRKVVQDLKTLFPTSNIFVCSFGPSPIRWHLISSVIRGNGLLQTLCEEEGATYFDLTTCFFDSNKTNGQYYLEGYGSLRTDIWLSDLLHFNALGYQVVTNRFIEFFNSL